MNVDIRWDEYGIGNHKLAIRADNLAGIADLTAHLGVERRGIQDDAALLFYPHGIYLFTVNQQSDNISFLFKMMVTDKLYSWCDLNLKSSIS